MLLCIWYVEKGIKMVNYKPTSKKPTRKSPQGYVAEKMLKIMETNPYYQNSGFSEEEIREIAQQLEQDPTIPEKFKKGLGKYLIGNIRGYGVDHGYFEEVTTINPQPKSKLFYLKQMSSKLERVKQSIDSLLQDLENVEQNIHTEKEELAKYEQKQADIAHQIQTRSQHIDKLEENKSQIEDKIESLKSDINLSFFNDGDSPDFPLAS